MKNLLLALFSFATHFLYSQNVGIGTANPRSKLEINGTLRVDTIKPSLNSKKVVVVDSATGNLGYIPVDSLKSSGSGGPSVFYYVENDTPTSVSVSSATPQTKVSITIPPGNYLIQSYCEVYNDNYVPGVFVKLTDGSNTLASSVPYAYNGMYGSWCVLKKISVSSNSTYYLQWSCAQNNSGNSFIRNARISAIKIQ